MQDSIYTRTEPLLLTIFPRYILLTLLELGYHEHEIFHGLDLNGEQLHDENYRLTIEQHERFILHALDLTKDPHLALRLNHQDAPATNNLALLAVANSGQIAKALYLVSRYFKLVTRTFSIRSLEIDDQAVMDIDVHLEHELVIYFAISNFVLFLNRFFDKALNGASLVQRVELTVPEPSGFSQISNQFPFDILFNKRSTRVLFDQRLLDQPMQQADAQTVRLLMEMSERQLQEAEAEMSLAGAVKSLLIEQIATPPKLDEAAQQLGLSSRSFRRKLAQAGTSYQTLLDEIRLKMARRLIRETNTPISAVAYELGFGNPSDFGRAFKRWTGQSPSSLRSK